ncbi:MAG: hypothetical protein ACOYLH_04430 [Flavobacteriales bacterium]|jgi:hypothetical protein
MKSLLVLLFIVSPFFSFAQMETKLIVTTDKDSYALGEIIHVHIENAVALNAEIAVFTDTFMGFYSNASLSIGKHDFEADSKDWPVGKYYVLVTAEGWRQQLEVTITE